MEENLIQKTYELAQENNRILRRMQRKARLSSFISTIKWIIIILLAFGSYYYVEPYLKTIMNLYTSIQSSANQLNKATSQIPNLTGLINFLPKQ